MESETTVQNVAHKGNEVGMGKLSIKHKMTINVVAVAIIMLAVGIAGYYGGSSVIDKYSSMGTLLDRSDATSTMRIAAKDIRVVVTALAVPELSGSERASIQKNYAFNIERYNAAVKSYLSNEFAPGEKPYWDKLDEAWKKFESTTAAMVKESQAGIRDRKAYVRRLAAEVNPQGDAYSIAMRDLVKYNMTQFSSRSSEAESASRKYTWVSFGLMGLGLLGIAALFNLISTSATLEVESQRIRDMVDNADINIMMADQDFNLIYMNKSSQRFMRQLEQYLPVRVNEMMGQSIDIFHKDPGRIRVFLSDPGNMPHEAEVHVGPEILKLHVVAIMDRAGKYIGPMLSWTQITEQKAQAERDASVEHKLAEIVVQLRHASENLVGVANAMAASSEENSSISNSVSSASEEVGQNVNSVAAAIEQMSATINEIANTVTNSSEVTKKAVLAAKKAQETIKRAEQSSEEISKVTDMIFGIAQQTNILALNATVEAARAGESGRGFSVVANEVKELAQQTGRATEDIASKIEAIRTDAVRAVKSMDEIATVLADLEQQATIIASAVEEQSVTTKEISHNMGEASTGVSEIVRNITGIAEAAKDSTQKSVEAKEAATHLASISGQLGEVTQMFLKKDQAKLTISAPAQGALPRHMSI